MINRLIVACVILACGIYLVNQTNTVAGVAGFIVIVVAFMYAIRTFRP